MTNPFSMQQQPYNQGVNAQMMQNNNMAYPQNLQIPPQNKSIAGTAVKGAVLGFTGGAIVSAGTDYFKNRRPVKKNGEVSETFVKRVLDKIVDKNYAAKGKKFFIEKLDVLRNLDSAKTPEKFRKLMMKNKEYCTTLCDGITLDTMCKTVSEDNIKDKISALKNRVEASVTSELQNVKDSISICWDKDKKKFVKPAEVDSQLFEIIKNTKNDINWKKVFKTGGITAGIVGALAVAYSIFLGKHQ